MENLIAMQRHIEAIRSASSVQLTENEVLMELLNTEERYRLKAEYDKRAVIHQARKYKEEIELLKSVHEYERRMVLTFSTIAMVVMTTIAWIWSYHSISSEYTELLNSKDQRIVEEVDRTADAESRVKNVIEAWNYTSSELYQCRGEK